MRFRHTVSGNCRTRAFPQSLAPVPSIPGPRFFFIPGCHAHPRSFHLSATICSPGSARRGWDWRRGRCEPGAPRAACGLPAPGRGDAGTRCPGRAPPPCGRPAALPELARLAVHAGQQQPGRLADVVAVHGEAAPVAGVRHGHPDPLHQWRQHEERPAGGRGAGARRRVSGGAGSAPPPAPHPAFPGGPASESPRSGRAFGDIPTAPVTSGLALPSLWVSVSSSVNPG